MQALNEIQTQFELIFSQINDLEKHKRSYELQLQLEQAELQSTEAELKQAQESVNQQKESIREMKQRAQELRGRLQDSTKQAEQLEDAVSKMAQQNDMLIKYLSMKKEELEKERASIASDLESRMQATKAKLEGLSVCCPMKSARELEARKQELQQILSGSKIGNDIAELTLKLDEVRVKLFEARKELEERERQEREQEQREEERKQKKHEEEEVKRKKKEEEAEVEREKQQQKADEAGNTQIAQLQQEKQRFSEEIARLEEEFSTEFGKGQEICEALQEMETLEMMVKNAMAHSVCITCQKESAAAQQQQEEGMGQEA